MSSEIKFCPKCGASLHGIAKPSIAKVGERRPPKGPDILGLVSAGVVLIILALTYIRNPIEPSVVINYLEKMGKQGALIKPPLALFDLAIFFFYTVGIWGIVLSGLRIIFERNVRKALGDLAGSFFSFFAAFLLTNYATDIFTARMALAYFVVAIGLLVVVNAVIYFAFPKE